jgi:hypothetical protein
MKRSRFLAAALALGGLLVAAEVRSASNDHQKSLEAFRKKSLADRRAQGLDKDQRALYAKYPTPQVQMVGGGGDTLFDLPVGTEKTLTINGRFVPGSFAHVNCVGVEVLSQKVTETKLELRVRALGTALPGACDMTMYSPVSLAHEALPPLRVTGTHQWELTTATGLKVRMRTSSQKDSQLLSGSTEWFSKEGKPLGTREATVERTEEGITVTVQRSKEEVQAAGKAWSAASKSSDMVDAQKESKVIQQKMQEECMKLPPAKLGACIQKYTDMMNAASNKMQNASKAAQQQADAGVVGCQMMKLQVVAGKVTGQGTNCGAPGEVNVTGTVTVTK